MSGRIIEKKTFVFENDKAYSNELQYGNIIFDWMNVHIAKSPFINFEVVELFRDKNGKICITYHVMATTVTQPHLVLKNLALQEINYN